MNAVPFKTHTNVTNDSIENSDDLLSFVMLLTDTPPNKRQGNILVSDKNENDSTGLSTMINPYPATGNNYTYDKRSTFLPSLYSSENNNKARFSVSLSATASSTPAHDIVGNTPTWSRSRSLSTVPSILSRLGSNNKNDEDETTHELFYKNNSNRILSLPNKLSNSSVFGSSQNLEFEEPDIDISEKSSFRNNKKYTWDNIWDNESDTYNNITSIPKSLTDLYALTFASKRWQNLNVVLPLFIPHGTIAMLRPSGESTYVFPDTQPGAQLLFSGVGKICDMWASFLRLRVAVIHKCPEFLVPKLAQVFNEKLVNLPKFAEPISIKCSGIVKHTIQLRSSGGLTYRYDTIGQLAREEDETKMGALFNALQNVSLEINNNLTKDVEKIMERLQQRGLISNNETKKSGLEMRFSPCRELKIAIREGTLCDCVGVDALIAGGGSSSMSAWAHQFTADPLIMGEIRLERDKTSETQLDPFFLPDNEIKTRMITTDMNGNIARALFVDPAVYPSCYRPRVEQVINMTPLKASEFLCNSTHLPLARLLPNGILSLNGETTNFFSNNYKNNNSFDLINNKSIESFNTTTKNYNENINNQNNNKLNKLANWSDIKNENSSKKDALKWLHALERMTKEDSYTSSSTEKNLYLNNAIDKTLEALNESKLKNNPEANNLLRHLKDILSDNTNSIVQRTSINSIGNFSTESDEASIKDIDYSTKTIKSIDSPLNYLNIKWLNNDNCSNKFKNNFYSLGDAGEVSTKDSIEID